ncbi:START domain-containing protein [Alishewanella tabrizica]|uniref:START domain-containing protein n=1 Tax=Alishewanella tabrizica TaxID=671278 RepID=A0ABQ2WG86_9ALTE|nr:START domain-containing protein [Alishewanella tabrizica]GGW49853.1 hypothetical protein GCM10008111_02050 [Alishewanella tabrizica]
MRTVCGIFLFLLFSFSCCVAAEEGWQLYQEQPTVRVEYRKNANELLQINASTTVYSSLGAFLHLLEDTANIQNWLVNSERAVILAQPDPYTHIVHTQFKAVWPVSPRDMITHSVWSQHPETGVVTLTVSDMGQQFPVKAGYIRMQRVVGVWTLTPLSAGQVHIEYEGQADPSGRLPQFLTNNVALKSTFQTFEKLATVLVDYQRLYPNLVELVIKPAK